MLRLIYTEIKGSVSNGVSQSFFFSPREGGLSSAWCSFRVVFRHGVLSQGGLSLGWSFVTVVFRHSGLSLEWSFVTVVFRHSGLSLGWSFVTVVFRHGGLSSYSSLISVVSWLAALIKSPRAHLHVVGMLPFMSDINQPSLPTPFYSVLVSISVFMALSTVFRSINSPDNSPFSHSVLPVLSLCPIGPFNYKSLYESLLQPGSNP